MFLQFEESFLSRVSICAAVSVFLKCHQCKILEFLSRCGLGRSMRTGGFELS